MRIPRPEQEQQRTSSTAPHLEVQGGPHEAYGRGRTYARVRRDVLMRSPLARPHIYQESEGPYRPRSCNRLRSDVG